MEQNRAEAPKPIAEKSYSGKFQVRITPELDRRLAIEAAAEKFSFNRYVSYQLAY